MTIRHAQIGKYEAVGSETLIGGSVRIETGQKHLGRVLSWIKWKSVPND